MVAPIQAKHKSKMLSLQEMIEKFLLLRKSPFATLSPNPDTILKTFFDSDSLSKAFTER